MIRNLSIASAVTVSFLIFCLLIIPQQKPLRFSGAMQALQLWTAQRAYPGTQVNDAQYAAEFTRLRSGLRTDRPLSAETGTWRAIGPHNIGGRTLAVAVNPQRTGTIYAGSASGGLWRSFTAGKGALAWERMVIGHPVLSVSSIAIAPNDSNMMIIGTGEVYNKTASIGGLSVRTTRGSYGIGILRTSDGGKSWQKTLDWSNAQQRGVQAVKLHPLHPHKVWAATTEGIYRSDDSGKSWTNVHPVVMGTDLVLDPDDTNSVVAAHGNLATTGAGVYRTTNGGTTWTKANGIPVSFGGKIQFSQYASAPNVLYASVGNGAVSGTWLCRSVDFGANWAIVSTQDYASYQGWYSHGVAVDPADSSIILTAGIDIWKSTNGGAAMTKKSDWAAWYFGVPPAGGPEGPPDYAHADHHAITYDPKDNSVVYFGNDGGVFCSTDGGETFEGRNGGYQTTQFYNGFSSSRIDSLLAMGGLQDNATAIYEGGLAWRRVIGGDGCMTAMSPTNKDTMYGAYQNLSLLRSVNRGISWSNIGVPTSAITSFVGPYALAESRPRTMYAGRDKIYKSTVGGGSWSVTNGGQVLDGNPALALAIAPTSPDTVYVTTAPVSSRAKMFRTTDGGTTWTNITGTLPDRYLIDIAIHPKNSALLYVTASGFGTSHLFRSTNAGGSWTDIGAGLPDVPTSAVAIDPFATEHLYVGNDLGVFLSTNGGGTWEPFMEGLAESALIMDLSVSYQNKAIRAVTHGNGVFERPLYVKPLSVRPEPLSVTGFGLEQNYPNPFNPSTTIPFRIAAAGRVRITVHDVAGRAVATLADEWKDAGAYSVQWNAGRFASGTYILRLTAGTAVAVRSIQLVK
ncbi:MAG: T9SS type A sorting domain-containing protein [Bacteroidetes bacterium]|nr:T9SS type A sorting domain-containing protein [Bacteroidota bacterium]